MPNSLLLLVTKNLFAIKILAHITTTETIFGIMPFLNELRNHMEMKNAITIPIRGARKIKATITSTVDTSMELNDPAWAIAAPAKPPISVCDELEGIPNHHVNKFHAMAAIRPETITVSVIYSWCTVFEMVLATPWSLKIKKAAKLKNAAHSTAWKGVNTLVETTVAMELAASWKPLI
jgi:hypothetical protein